MAKLQMASDGGGRHRVWPERECVCRALALLVQ